ncbi:heat shock protein 70 kDa 12B [Rhizoctonia solani]|uniref:Heat shock protein 70 kDa 12B n=1 Tax=Rhizoctonia solani TaxID=456999 RepID=A0A8H8NXT1_9AGAM|nr:heat shock protein 70 kDa 12B [Rhizoctonia solani]QRW20316.1 heat shock protein 70 kDa 12B [Rhizoctonia solani]
MSIDATPKPFRGPWEGDTKIVIGIDIGTTQSGVAFAFLQNGASQVIHRVTRWPGQEARDQQGKIPTLVWYDRSRKATAFGAEAQLPIIEEQAEDNGWVLAKYFKLHLHPSDMQAKHELKLDELPPGVTLRQIYSDFLGYLLKHTRSFFEDRILDGKQIWSRYSPTMEVVIAHPNGWGIREQAFLRSAAVAAGFATTDQAPTKVRFVTEAEASVHFCIHHTNLGTVLKPGTNFAVCDAGGSTVDTTLYSVTSMRPILKLKEERASACVQAGAIFVDSEVEKHLRKTLANAGLSSEDVVEYTKAGVKDFEGFAKRAFRDETTEQSVAVAHTRFNNTTIRARRGRMSFPGLIIKEFFDVCVKEITASVDQQINGLNVPYILLVGGFGDSVYVRNEFKKRYESRGSKITLTNDSSSKAVADGALIWSTISSVHSRAPRYSFGIKILVPFLSHIHTRQGRVSYTDADGEEVVSGGWSQIVQKGVALDSEVVCRRRYHCRYSTGTPYLEVFTIDLISYSGDGTPEWVNSPNGSLCPGFRTSCTIKANLKNLEGALTSATGRHGLRYWSLSFEVCIRFGGTELESYLEWEEHGIKRTGPASIVSQEINL